jgi:hypothetical protein
MSKPHPFARGAVVAARPPEAAEQHWGNPPVMTSEPNRRSSPATRAWAGDARNFAMPDTEALPFELQDAPLHRLEPCGLRAIECRAPRRIR